MHFHMHTSTMVKPPKMTTANVALRLFITLAAICRVAAAHASLGGDSASVEADRVHMNVKHAARLTPSSTGSYTVHETILPTGTRVRQYVSKAGVVFAVAWSGPFVPDLRQLLGPHFDTMTARQAKRVHAGHRFVSQHESDLVIESGGHPRSFVGRAYLPSALPAGVAEKDIQ
jgi:Protein of unknown function (DUF2844)